MFILELKIGINIVIVLMITVTPQRPKGALAFVQNF